MQDAGKASRCRWEGCSPSLHPRRAEAMLFRLPPVPCVVPNIARQSQSRALRVSTVGLGLGLGLGQAMPTTAPDLQVVVVVSLMVR